MFIVNLLTQTELTETVRVRASEAVQWFGFQPKMNRGRVTSPRLHCNTNLHGITPMWTFQNSQKQFVLCPWPFQWRLCFVVVINRTTKTHLSLVITLHYSIIITLIDWLFDIRKIELPNLASWHFEWFTRSRQVCIECCARPLPIFARSFRVVYHVALYQWAIKTSAIPSRCVVNTCYTLSRLFTSIHVLRSMFNGRTANSWSRHGHDVDHGCRGYATRCFSESCLSESCLSEASSGTTFIRSAINTRDEFLSACRAGPGRAGPGRAGPSRTGSDRAGLRMNSAMDRLSRGWAAVEKTLNIRAYINVDLKKFNVL